MEARTHRHPARRLEARLQLSNFFTGNHFFCGSEDASAGTACIAERRALEILEHGEPKTDWLRFNDRVRIEALDGENRSPFGAIDHTFVPLPAEVNT